MENLASLNAALARLERLLPRPADTVPRDVLCRYGAAVEGNFVTWLAAAALRCTAPEAREAVKRNLMLEIVENHASMLRDLLVSKKCLPSDRHQAQVGAIVDRIRSIAASGSPVMLLATLAYLEAAALLFLPLLDGIVDVGARPSPYVAAHVRADVEHAEEMRRALALEVECHGAESIHAAEAGIEVGEQLLIAVGLCHPR